MANYTYSGANHDLTRLDYGNGDSVSYTYDNQGRLTKESYENRREFLYTYDNSGNLGSVKDSGTVVTAGTTTKYSYDLTNRLSRVEQRDSSTIRSIDYRYDNLGRMSSWSYNIPGLAADTISYFYDSDKENTIPEGTLTSMTTNNGATMGYTYDKLQRLTDKYITDEIWDRYAYNGGSSQVAAKTVWIENDLLNDYRYFYDGNGNIVAEQDILRGYTQNYTYDVSRQLTGVSVNYGDTTRTESYTYDDAGNLLTFNNGVKSHTLTYGDSQWGDLLTAVDGETITYDGMGNPTSYYDGYRYTFEWEHGRQLKSMTYNGNTIRYEYDANGIRTKKINPTGMSTDYYVMDGKAIGEVVKHTNGIAAYWLRYLFDESDQVIGLSFWCQGDTAWTEFYFAKNLQGDVVGVYRASDNAQVAVYEYDAWGNILYMYGELAEINPFRYRTYYYDNETWFYYLQSRYYDPAIGRFINADNIMAGVGGETLGYNMFAYCFNNPVNMSDSSGHWPQWMKNTVKWVAKNVVKPVVKTVQKALAKVDLTYSTGFNVSGTPSAWIFNGQIGVSVDTEGTVALQYSGGGGISTGDPGLSITRYYSITNAPSIDKLNDAYYQIGGSKAGDSGGVPVAIGGDIMFMPDLELNTGYSGLTGNLGLGTPGKEFHVEWGETGTFSKTQFNVFDVAQSIYTKIMEW